MSEAYEDHTPIYEEEDPFIIRFRVRPLVWLDKDKAIPIHTDEVWNTLSFTRDHDKSSSSWTGKLRGSLTQLDDADAQFLEKILFEQAREGREYPLDARELKLFTARQVRRVDRDIQVSVPDNDEDTDIESDPSEEIRESLQIQALLADIGVKLRLQIWVPSGDRARVLSLMEQDTTQVLDRLPINSDDVTLTTIENIDVIWLKGRSIVRAFEVEHTTSIYSGILRMADLLALQPNMDIKLHIVAPEARKAKVFSEVQRPVFSYLERGPLAELCTYLSYDSVREIAENPYLHRMTDHIVEDYAEETE